MAVVVHKKSRIPYLYLGENRFRNMTTLKEGVVEDETAREVFAIHPEATILCEEFPLVKELIKRLELRIEK